MHYYLSLIKYLSNNISLSMYVCVKDILERTYVRTEVDMYLVHFCFRYNTVAGSLVMSDFCSCRHLKVPTYL